MSSILKSKKIPAVAITSLVVGGACDRGGDGGVSPTSVARQMCSNAERCGEYFSDYYDSVAECTQVIRRELEEEMAEYREYYSAACANAYLEGLDCYVSAYADCEMTDGEERACYALYADLERACGDM